MVLENSLVDCPNFMAFSYIETQCSCDYILSLRGYGSTNTKDWAQWLLIAVIGKAVTVTDATRVLKCIPVPIAANVIAIVQTAFVALAP